jgi:predicted ATPase
MEDVEPQPPELALLQEALTDRQLLLILDNCEHLVVACADLAAAVLTTCPSVRLLATSREPLGVPGEAVYLVPPLDAPSRRDAAQATQLADYDAVRLVIERARLARADFSLSEANPGAVLIHR